MKHMCILSHGQAWAIGAQYHLPRNQDVEAIESLPRLTLAECEKSNSTEARDHEPDELYREEDRE
jgi:hypothetical protein